ncbi:MAG: tetratricopeptide repeat protein [Flammeovirgaceae bacterium]|nr:tetratricopeptide repeat protein [Flammeovirgaceae bacterium]
MKQTLAFLFLAIIFFGCDKSDDYFKKGKTAFNQGDYKNAIANFDSVLALKPNHPEAVATRASALYNTGEYVEALVDYTRGIELWPKDDQNKITLAPIYLRS